MDGLNNNTINDFDLNYGKGILFADDVQNHNESRTTARITPLTNAPYTSQECHRMSIDRMKDRQIAILMQKNNQLQMDVLTMQHRVSSHLPMMHEYGMLDQFGMNSNHLQLKLLTTALDEKSEELKQAKDEHDLIMEERSAVHKELREQAADIERLTRQNTYLQKQLCGYNLNSFDSSMKQNEELTIQLKEMVKENERLKFEISNQERLIQNLTNEKEKTCKQLDQVVNHYYYLKKSCDKNRLIAESKFQRFTDEKYEMLTETIKITDLKMALLNIVVDDSGDSDKCDGRKPAEQNKLSKYRNNDNENGFHLRPGDKILDIDGVDVVNWTDERILDHLSRYGSVKYIKVILSRAFDRAGTFSSWKAPINLSAVESFDLSPLWLVTKSDNSTFTKHINAGDILQVQESSDGSDSAFVVRLSPSPFKINCVESINQSNKLNTINSTNEINPLIVVKPCMFSPPVLPIKRLKRPSDFNVHPKSLDRLTSLQNKMQYVKGSSRSNISLVSAPPIPPRSSISLQSSFTDNIETSCISTQDYAELHVNEDSNSERLKMSIYSAFSGNGDIGGSMLSADMMSASFSGSGDFVSTKMPKLGKCRNLILGIPSQVFNLKQLGLHLFHSKNEQCPSSKSDVDISIINQIFIRYIEPNSSARQAGLFEGDEILSINNQSVSRMTSEEAEHILLTNPLKQQHLNKEQKKLSLRIKVQFNPLKMYELSKGQPGPSLESNIRFPRFTRSMYDDSRSGSFTNDKWPSHRLHVIRSSSNLNICESADRSVGIAQHLLTKTRTVRINMCSILNQIKIMGGSAVGIFISNILYGNKELETIDKESVGNRLALGDKILEINGESYERAIGEDTIMSLNRFGHQVILNVLYDPSGLLAINSDPLCQEHFYMEAMFSFSDFECKLSPVSSKIEKRTSLSTRLDNFGFNIYFVRNYHLNFEKGDILLVDATILPSSMTRKQQDNSIGSDWHAWVVDKSNNKIRSGMIPSALWIQKMMTSSNKSPFYRSTANDKNAQFSMRSTPNSPKSDINTFLSSNSAMVSHTCSRPHRHNSLSQKLFRRFSFRNSFHSTTASVEETNKKIPFTKDVAFKPLKRISGNIDYKRLVVMVGPHSDTISMILASKWPQDFALTNLKAVMESKDVKELHQIISPVTIKSVTELHQRGIYPIVLLLKYKSAKEIRQLKIGKSTQITVSKSDSFKLFSQIKEFESHWPHLIHGTVTPYSSTESFQEIRDIIAKIQLEDIWLRIDRYQYSA